MKSPQLLAIVPAHNEQKIIANTIVDLLNQSLGISILIVADNCSDDTVSIVKEFERQYPNVKLMETVDNNKKKAGAVNQAITAIGNYPLDAILLMDADTRIDVYAVERAWNTLSSDRTLAAVCSKAGVLPYEGKNLFEWFLYYLQRLEYSLFDSQRVETLGCIKVVHGMAALHRWSSILEVGGFDDDNLVEDYDLTIRYKEAGYNVTIELEMKAWTEVPVKLRDWWKQRLRWNRGGVDTLKKHGWNVVTKNHIIQHYVMNIITIFQWVFLIMFVALLFRGGLLMHGLVLIITLLSMSSSIYRLKYLEERNVLDYVFRLLLIPELLYGILQTSNQYHAYYNFLTNKKQSW
jgi:cellulose synthase/poly-beta-1,6-N-acetylglucosamine synthase-like glycosyltransferase